VRGIFIPSGSRLWLNNISYHFVASYILRLIENSDGCMYHNDRFLKRELSPFGFRTCCSVSPWIEFT